MSEKLMKVYLTIPHNNADSEQTFLTVNNNDTENHSDSAKEIIAAIIK